MRDLLIISLPGNDLPAQDSRWRSNRRQYCPEHLYIAQFLCCTVAGDWLEMVALMSSCWHRSDWLQLMWRMFIVDSTETESGGDWPKDRPLIHLFYQLKKVGWTVCNLPVYICFTLLLIGKLFTNSDFNNFSSESLLSFCCSCCCYYLFTRGMCKPFRNKKL